MIIFYKYRCRDCDHEFEISPPQDVICHSCWNYNLEYLGKRKEENNEHP